MQISGPSARERNRVATWTALHDAAATLALDDGVAATSIGAITAQAGVSARTFFNYFPSKEDAILGTAEPTLPDDAVEAFRGEPDLLTAVVRLMMAITRTAAPDSSLSRRRREIVMRFPELRSRIAQLTMSGEKLAMPVVADRMLRDGMTTGSTTEDRALGLVMTASTLLRYTAARDPETYLDDREAAVTDALDVLRSLWTDVL